MGPSLQLSTCVLFWGFLGLFVPVVEGTKPRSSSVSSQANAILSRNKRMERPLPWQRGHPVQGGKGSLHQLPNIKLIEQQAAKLWGFFANNAISRRDLDL